MMAVGSGLTPATPAPFSFGTAMSEFGLVFFSTDTYLLTVVLYSITSVGHGADPSLLAVSPQVTQS